MQDVAGADHLLLLWTHFSGLCIPSVLLVRCFLRSGSTLTLVYYSMRYSRMLEESSFANRSADYLWLLLSSSFLLLLLSPLVNMPFLSAPLAFVPVYVWSRRHPSTQISLFGLMTITAPYLPIALVAISSFLNGSWTAALGDLMGCAVGHIGWFARDVWPREMMGSNGFWNEAPDSLFVFPL
jgi:Derlin-2/3